MSGEAILYGNSPAAVRQYIQDTVGVGVVVANEPNPRPDRFVMLSPSGGSDLSVTHDQQLMIVDSWGSTIAEAHDLAQLVRAHLHAIRNTQVGDVLIYVASPIGGVVWMPDPDSDTSRFRQNFQFVTRGRAI